MQLMTNGENVIMPVVDCTGQLVYFIVDEIKPKKPKKETQTPPPASPDGADEVLNMLKQILNQ